MIQGFKEFIARGNAIDLAVGMIIGAAFTAVITAIVDKFLNPLIGGIFGSPNFDSVAQFTLGSGENAAVVQPGAILTAVVNFLIIAAALYFAIIYPMNVWAARTKKKEETEPEEEPTPVTDVELLTEIRDLLAARRDS